MRGGEPYKIFTGPINPYEGGRITLKVARALLPRGRKKTNSPREVRGGFTSRPRHHHQLFIGGGVHWALQPSKTSEGAKKRVFRNSRTVSRGGILVDLSPS